MTTTDNRSISVTLDEDLADRLNQAANDRVIGRSLLVSMAIEEFLNRLIPLDTVTATHNITKDHPVTS